MRMRVIAAVVVLGLGGVTGIRAQQPAAAPRKSGPTEKANLRSRLITMQAELALMELEQEADKAHLLKAMTAIREAEAMTPEQAMVATEMVLSAASADFQNRESAREQARQKKLQGLSGEDAMRALEETRREIDDARKRDISDTIKKNADTAKAYIDRKKRDYFRQAEEIAKKRLELSELEKRYNDAK